LAVIIGPIVQEVAVRHFFSRCLYRSYSLITVILLQAVMFGVGHMNSIQGIYTFIGGILFMVLVLWMDNLYPAVISHMSCNLYAVVVSPFLYKYGIDLKMFFAVLIIPLLFMVYKRRQYDALDKNNPYWR
jgi:hypothetical protein